MATKKTVKKDPVEKALENISKIMKDKSPIIKKYSSKDKKEKVEVIPFGIDALDEASNCGGIPRGKMVEIFGPESGGKSYVCLQLIASAQKMGLNACLLDIENSFDPVWAAKQGINVDDLWITDDAPSAERSLEYVYQLAKSNMFGLIVVDSTAALVPSKELEGSLEDSNVALLARAMSSGCRKIQSACTSSGTTVVFINQIREQMSGGFTYGPNTTTPGGKALKFYSHIRLDIRPGKVEMMEINGKNTPVKRLSYAKFVKNKVAMPYGSCEFYIVFDKDLENPVVKLCNAAKDAKLIKLYKGEYRITGDVLDQDKALPTGTYSVKSLANYIIDNEYVTQLLDALWEYHDHDTTDIPKDVIALYNDPSLATRLDYTETASFDPNQAPPPDLDEEIEVDDDAYEEVLENSDKD